MRIRKLVNGTPEQPRMTVFRSNKQIAAETAGKTKSEVAAMVGKLAAQRAVEKGISTVSFDRNGYLYHGRIKMLADAAREGGLKF